MKDNKMLISVLHRQVQHTCTLTPTCNKWIHSHKATCHHTDTTCECKDLAEEYFIKKCMKFKLQFNQTYQNMNLKICFVCMYVFESMYVQHVYAMPMEAQRGLQMS